MPLPRRSGKLVLSTPVLTLARATGVELLQARASAASAALADALGKGLLSGEEGSRVKLLHADATEEGVLPRSGTHAFLVSQMELDGRGEGGGSIQSY